MLLHYQARGVYYIIRQEEFITLSGKRSLLHYQARGVYYNIRQQLLHYQAASLLHYRVMLLRYQEVITLSGDVITLSCDFLLHYQAVMSLTGDYNIISCNNISTTFSIRIEFEATEYSYSIRYSIRIRNSIRYSIRMKFQIHPILNVYTHRVYTFHSKNWCLCTDDHGGRCCKHGTFDLER